jgi:hypothetical protein
MTEYKEQAMVEAPFDEEMYQAARPHLRDALEYTIALGRSAHDWGEFCLEKFGVAVTPYLKRFIAEVEPYTLKIERWSDCTKQIFLGAEMNPDERDRRVREAAYFRAERRGFVGGSPEQDWMEAEHEIDEQIAAQMGVIEKAREAVSSLGELALKGFECIKDTLKAWMARRSPSEGQQPA